LEFNVPFQHKYGYIRDERSKVMSQSLRLLLYTNRKAIGDHS